MKFKGIIRNVGEAVIGTSKTTGREWTKRELVIAVAQTAYPKEAYPKSLPKGGTCEAPGTESPSFREGFRMGSWEGFRMGSREGFRMGSSLMVGSYFGEATKEQLLALAEAVTPLEFTVYFDVHKHEQRYYQDIRIGDIKTIVQ